MNVYLTFDVEVWCDGRANVDERFPAAFQRYYFGRSEAGDYALPKTLGILNRHALHGVFFGFIGDLREVMGYGTAGPAILDWVSSEVEGSDGDGRHDDPVRELGRV